MLSVRWHLVMVLVHCPLVKYIRVQLVNVEVQRVERLRRLAPQTLNVPVVR